MSSLGDILHTTPVLQAIRETNPSAKIGWATSDIWAQAIQHNPLVDEIFLIPKSYWRQGHWARLAKMGRAWREHTQVVAAIRRADYQLSIDVQESLLSALIVRAAGVPHRAGFEDARDLSRWLLNLPVHCPASHFGPRDRPLALAAALGFRATKPRMYFPILEEDRQAVRAMMEKWDLDAALPLVVLVPSTSWASKCWAPERFAALGDRLVRECGATIVVLGAKPDRLRCEAVLTQMEEAAIPLVGQTTLRQSGALLEQASLCVAGDTGPLYIAAALGTPVLGLFGPTTSGAMFKEFEPHRIIHYPDRCRCYLRSKRFCRYGDCMEAISVEETFQAARALLSQSRPPRPRPPTLRPSTTPLRQEGDATL